MQGSRPDLPSPLRSAAVVILACFFLAITGAQWTGTGATPRVPDPVLDLRNGLDAPVHRIGDFWNYSTDFVYSISGLNIPFSGWLNLSVVGITLDPFLGMAPVYMVNITGNVTGSLYIPFILDLDIYIDLTGYIWNKVQDLSLYRTVLNASVSGTEPSLAGDYPFGYEYSPPLEEYDFPLVQGDAWWTNVSASLPFGTSGDAIHLNSTYSVHPFETVTVPAGTFKAVPISIDGVRSLFYNSTVGNTVRRTYSFDIEGTIFEVPFELESYYRGPYDVSIELSVDDPQPVEAGSSFKVSGRTSVSNTIITFFFPDGTVADAVSLILGDRDFKVTLDAPAHTDDSLTSIDHGSFGILAVAGMLNGIAVVTVTTRSRDLEVLNGSISISHEGEGTVDDLFTADLRVFNPSNYGANDFTVVLSMDGTGEVHNSSFHSLPAKEVLVLAVDFRVHVAGHYNLTLTVDPENRVNEYNESNNIMNTGFIVLERPLLVWNTSMPPGELTLPEGSFINLSASALRRGEELEGVWSMDGDRLEGARSITFRAEHTGSNSSRDVPYTFMYMLHPGQTYPDETDQMVWNITVTDVDRPPEIITRRPLADEIWMSEGEGTVFDVSAEDPDGDRVDFLWSIDGTIVQSFGPAFGFHADYLGANSSEGSPFILSLTITDGKGQNGTVILGWTVHVNDTDRPFIYSTDPLPGNVTMRYEETLSISFNASDLDGTPVHFIWACLGRVSSNGTTFEFVPALYGLTGSETVQVFLSLGSGAHSHDLAWNITVLKREVPHIDEPLKGVRIIKPTEGQIFIEGTDIGLIGEDSDERELVYTWKVGNLSLNGSSVTLKMLEGEYTAVLRVHLLSNSSIASIRLVNFTVVQVDEDDQGKGLDPWLLFLLIVPIALLAIVGLIVLSMRRKERLPEWTEE